jgi:hypothetical protein
LAAGRKSATANVHPVPAEPLRLVERRIRKITGSPDRAVASGVQATLNDAVTDCPSATLVSASSWRRKLSAARSGGTKAYPPFTLWGLILMSKINR